jgi:urease accessory protein
MPIPQHASIHRSAGHWPGEQAASAVTLDFEARHRRRTLLTLDDGEVIILNLPRAVAMSDGDGLQLEDGRWVRVHASKERLVEIRHPDPVQLVRLAWHLGNRHLPTDICGLLLRIRPDHVIEAMLRGMGADLKTVEASFQPVGGAYGSHGHSHQDGEIEPHHG